jgi:3'(2'), 5'-bisphosphate nucleotidase
MIPDLPYDPDKLLLGIKRAAFVAGAKILAVYATDFDADVKADHSPVTEADTAAEAIILPLLRTLTPDIPIVAEEAAAAGDIPDVGDGPFWLVDPLDGTKEFLKRNGEFTVNIALIVNHQPVMGVVLLPAKNCLYSGIVGVGAWRQEGDGPVVSISVRPAPEDGLTVIGSRSHGDANEMADFLKGHTIAEVIAAGSSLKFCLVAEGTADVYPRLGRTMEWDVAAGHAVLAAAGGRVTFTDDTPFTYSKNPIFENPHFVAWGGL